MCASHDRLRVELVKSWLAGTFLGNSCRCVVFVVDKVAIPSSMNWPSPLLRTLLHGVAMRILLQPIRKWMGCQHITSSLLVFNYVLNGYGSPSEVHVL